MSKLMRCVVIVSFIFLLSIVSVYAASECTTRCCDEEYPRLVIQGEGKIETMADKAYFQIRLRTEEKKLERAFEIITEKINSISDTLKSFGIKKEDIRNLGYIYHPLYEGKPIFSTIRRPTSYEVIYSLKVTVYSLDNLGKILTGLSEISETTVYGFTYTSTKIDELKREVLKKAASDAREKALKLAEGSGATLGKAVKIETAAQEYPVARQRMADVAFEKSFVMKEEQGYPQVESGYLEIIGNCTISYVLQ